MCTVWQDVPRKSFIMLLKILQASRASRVFTFGPFLISLHSFEFNIGLFKLPSKLSVARIVPQIKHLQISDFFLQSHYCIYSFKANINSFDSLSKIGWQEQIPYLVIFTAEFRIFQLDKLKLLPRQSGAQVWTQSDFWHMMIF